MPEGSGVMLALVTSPQGPARWSPPAKGSSSTALWQPHPTLTMYLPRAIGLDISGPATGAVIGSGTLRTRYFTGKLTVVGGSEVRTGCSDRKYTTTEARSSSESSL